MAAESYEHEMSNTDRQSTASTQTQSLPPSDTAAAPVPAQQLLTFIITATIGTMINSIIIIIIIISSSSSSSQDR